MLGGGIGISWWRSVRAIGLCCRSHSNVFRHPSRQHGIGKCIVKIRQHRLVPSVYIRRCACIHTFAPNLFIFIYKLTTHSLPSPERPTCSRLSLLSSNLRFSPIQNLQELCNSMPHPRVHVCFGTLDMVMEVIAE